MLTSLWWHHLAYIMLTSSYFQEIAFLPQKTKSLQIDPYRWHVGRPLLALQAHAYLIMMTSSWWHHLLTSLFSKNCTFAPKRQNFCTLVLHMAGHHCARWQQFLFLFTIFLSPKWCHNSKIRWHHHKASFGFFLKMQSIFLLTQIFPILCSLIHSIIQYCFTWLQSKIYLRKNGL